MTFSIHRFEQGFFPGTGKKPLDGAGKGKGYEINVPTKKGLSDGSFNWVVTNIIIPLIDRFTPKAIVIQCGGDGLCSDLNFHEWNLTMKGYSSALLSILNHIRVPTLMVGGGGYNNLETAKLWCLLTGQLTKGREECLRWDLLPDSADYGLIGMDETE
ncbi:DEKNAAC100223, partial [Brettanomyces naardenensis]